MTAEPGQSIPAEEVKDTVQAAGFTPREMTATIVGAIETRDEGRYLVWETGEIPLDLSGVEQDVEDGHSVRAVGILDIRRERGVTSSAFAVHRIEPTSP